jgi:hypothetical protein
MGKLYNNTVLTAMLWRKHRELDESGDLKLYQLYKGSLFIVISDRRALRGKDSVAHENNERLNAISMKCLKWPAGASKMHAENEQRLAELLAVNGDLRKAYFLLDQLKASFQETDPKVCSMG